MSQIRRDRLAAVIHAWKDGARLLERGPAGASPAEQRLVGALLSRLQAYTTMVSLAEAFLDDAGWPADLPWPAEVDRRTRQGLVVAAAYWCRYLELLARATDRPADPPIPTIEPSAPRSPASLGPEFGHLELLYTVKLWQRGPLRLRALPPDRRSRYEPLVEMVYTRLAGCGSVRALAARYYGDGDWVLQFARDALQPLGEPISNIGWVQDAACWRRYQELLDASPVRQAPDDQPPEFAIWLAGQMARRRISVAELAYRLGTPAATVRSWLHAADVPSQEYGRRLAAAFGLSESQMPRTGGAAR